MKIRTENHGVFEGQWQWSAIDEDNGPESPMGVGETEEAAAQDLREQLAD